MTLDRSTDELLREIELLRGRLKTNKLMFTRVRQGLMRIGAQIGKENPALLANVRQGNDDLKQMEEWLSRTGDALETTVPRLRDLVRSAKSAMGTRRPRLV